MKIRILIPARIEKPMIPLINEYIGRIQRRCPIELIEIKGELVKETSDVPQALLREANRIFKHVPEGWQLIALTQNGVQKDSMQFAEYLSQKLLSSTKGLAFVVGSAFGLHKNVLNRADLCLSLSKMTLPHQVACLMFCEQLFRAFTIIKREPYHK